MRRLAPYLTEPVTRVWGDRRSGVELDPLERLGTVAGEWSLVGLLGVGGTSAVYEAVGRHGERVAVKVLRRPDVAPGDLLREATREARLTRAVGHTGVVDVRAVGSQVDGSAYLVMGLLEGHTLENRRYECGGAIAYAAALPLFDALFDVVAAAHDRGIIHHDLKPGNVFLTRSGQVKLIDFGLARTGLELDQPSGWFGTPGFVAPEQARGEITKCDRRSDVWSLGATMFVVLSGHGVHVAHTHDAEVPLAAAYPARSLRAVAPELPAALVALVDRALAFEPGARWTDVRAMHTALRSLVLPPGPRPSGVRLIEGG